MPLRKSATERKEYGCPNRVNGHRVGRTGSVPRAQTLREPPQRVVPYCISTVGGKKLSEAELQGLEGLAVLPKEVAYGQRLLGGEEHFQQAAFPGALIKPLSRG